MYIPRTTQASSPNGTRSNRWIQGEGAIVGIISLSVILSLFLFGAIVLIARNWAWWHVRDSEGRRRYVKTWHGWTDKEKHEERHQHYKDKRDDLRDTFRWKSTSASMASVFRDPNGSKEQLYMKLRQRKMMSWMPRWMRNWSPGASKPDYPFDLQQKTQNRRSNSHSHDIELGIAQSLSHRRQTDFRAGEIAQVDGPPSDIHTVRSVRFMTESMPSSSDDQNASGATVQIRRGDTIDSSAWHANSSETSRVSVAKFLLHVSLHGPVMELRSFAKSLHQLLRSDFLSTV